MIDAADLEVWQASFGRLHSSAAPAGAAVPEPAAMVMIVCAMVAGVYQSHNGRAGI
jgi:hypothetical protein